MKLVLGVLGILAASIGTAQAQFNPNGNSGFQVVPNAGGGSSVYNRQNWQTPMGTIEPNAGGGFSYNPNSQY